MERYRKLAGFYEKHGLAKALWWAKAQIKRLSSQ